MAEFMDVADPSWYPKVLRVLARHYAEVSDAVWGKAIDDNAAEQNRLRFGPNTPTPGMENMIDGHKPSDVADLSRCIKSNVADLRYYINHDGCLEVVQSSPEESPDIVHICSEDIQTFLTELIRFTDPKR